MDREHSCGFAVEVTDTTVKIFTVEQGVVERENFDDENTPELDRTKIGGWYQLFPDGYEQRCEIKLPDFEIFEKDGQCHVRVVAIGPNYFGLPKEMRPKFKMVVWSPILGYLNDKERIFNRNVQGGVAEQCVVKYAPTDKSVFEIVDIEDREKELETATMSIYHQTPWDLDHMARNMKPMHEVVPKELGCIDRFRAFSAEATTVGVCIANKVTNVNYTIHKADHNTGCEQFCSYLWSPMFGLTRWLIQPTVKVQPGDTPVVSAGNKNYVEPTENKKELGDDGLERLGNWYSYKLNDYRKKKVNGDGMSSFSNVTATSVKRVDAEKQYKVIPKSIPNAPDCHELLMQVSFPFKRENIVDPTYGVTQFGWRILRNAHFFDPDLGKVEIYPRQGMQILDEIEKHQKELQELSPAEWNELKDEVIIICSWVTVLYDYMSNSKVYPENGLFMLKSVEKIHYLQGGRIIFENETKEN